MISDYQTSPLGMNPDDDFRISIAGAQEKTALLRMDGSGICLMAQCRQLIFLSFRLESLIISI